MSVEENKTTAVRIVEEIFNKGNFALMPELISLDFIAHITPELRGHERLRQHIVDTRKVFPDVHYTISHIIAEGDLVASRVTLEGTHTGAGNLMGLGAPTGKRVSIAAIRIERFARGKLIEAWQESNINAIYQQLGFPPPGYGFAKK